MKYRMTLKTPDCCNHMLDSADEGTARDNLYDLVQDYVRYGEYVTLEFDTQARTVTVVPV